MFYFYTCVYCLVFHLPKPLLLSQEHLKGNSTYAQVVLKQFTLGTSPIAGAKIIGDSFLLSLPPQIPQGVYRLQYAFAQNEQYLDIIINGKDKNIAFTLQADEPNSIHQFTQSEENQKPPALSVAIHFVFSK